MNFTSKIKLDFNLQRTVLVHFGNNLDFKATHEFYLDFKSTLIKKKTVLAHFENNLDFKGTHEFYLKNQG